MCNHPLSKEMFLNVNRPVLHPVQYASAHLAARQLVRKDALRDSIKSIMKIQESHIHLLLFAH